MSLPVANLLNQLCPEAMILGGSLFRAYGELYALVVQACQERLLPHILHRVAFVRGDLDPDAALVGMATQVFLQNAGLSMARWAHVSL